MYCILFLYSRYNICRDSSFVLHITAFGNLCKDRKDLVFQPSPERFQLSMDEEDSGNQDWPKAAVQAERWHANFGVARLPKLESWHHRIWSACTALCDHLERLSHTSRQWPRCTRAFSKPLKGERNVKRHQIVVEAMQLRE